MAKLPINAKVEKAFDELDGIIVALYNEGVMKQKKYISVHNKLVQAFRMINETLDKL